MRRLERLIAGIFVIALSGCFLGYWTYGAAGGGNETGAGEQHDTPYPAQETSVWTQDVLRSQGVPFDMKPDGRIVTHWRDADTSASLFGSMLGVKPEYRYEIEVVPTGPRTSRIVANVATKDIADNEIASYLPVKRLDLFNKFDQLAATFPPPASTPRQGGVNFAVLPGEDLKALSKRATGKEDNWQKIAADNGLTSEVIPPTVGSIWVRDALLDKSTPKASAL